MKGGIAYAFAAVLVAGLVLAGAFYAGILPPGSQGSQHNTGGPSGSSSFQNGNRTFVATLMTSLSSSTGTTSTVGSYSSGGSYTYTPSAQMKLLSVAAGVSGTQSGGQVVTFTVQVQNAGSNTVYVLGGGGSSLNAVITSGSTTIRQTSGPRCEIATTMVPLSPGQSWTARTPGCWSGYSYQLVQPGTIQVQLTLSWSGDSNGSSGGSMQIDASFALD